jgi:hypothetical protein
MALMNARKDSMRRLGATGLALLAVATLGPSAAAEEKFQKLSGGQIRAKLAGMELTDNVHWSDLYQRNGTVMSTSMGRKRTGKWRVEQNQLCIEFEKEPVPNCYDVALRKRSRAAARRSFAVAGHPRAVHRGQLNRTEGRCVCRLSLSS